MNIVTAGVRSLPLHLDHVGRWLAPLGLRLLLAWEFFEAGWQKLRGENWFTDIQDQFPLPFNLLPAQLNWTAVTWAELIGAAALLLGLGTRAAAAMLMVVTAVATASVHWPMQWGSLAELAQGYAITDDGAGNFKLPLIFMAMLLPLLLQGPGQLSVDAWLGRRLRDSTPCTRGHWLGWVGSTAFLALLSAWLWPALAITLGLLAVMLLILQRLQSRQSGASVRLGG